MNFSGPEDGLISNTNASKSSAWFGKTKNSVTGQKTWNASRNQILWFRLHRPNAFPAKFLNVLAEITNESGLTYYNLIIKCCGCCSSLSGLLITDCLCWAYKLPWRSRDDINLNTFLFVTVCTQYLGALDTMQNQPSNSQNSNKQSLKTLHS